MATELDNSKERHQTLLKVAQEITDRLVDAAEVAPGQAILEPSASCDDIVGALLKAHPELQVDVCGPVRDWTSRPTVTWAGPDFLELPLARTYDRIVANPPFSSERSYILKMFDHLRPGGRMASFLTPRMFSEDLNSQRFRGWLREHQAEIVSVGGFSTVPFRIAVINRG